MKKHLISMALCVGTLCVPQGMLWADDNDHKPTCADCGVVTAVQPVEKTGGSGLGAAAGALAGGLLGNQAGKTDAATSTIGGTATTILGVAGGAVTGHYAEQALRGSKEWNVMVRMDNGETRTVNMKSEPSVKTGDRVRVAEGSVVRDQTPVTNQKAPEMKKKSDQSDDEEADTDKEKEKDE